MLRTVECRMRPRWCRLCSTLVWSVTAAAVAAAWPEVVAAVASSCVVAAAVGTGAHTLGTPGNTRPGPGRETAADRRQRRECPIAGSSRQRPPVRAYVRRPAAAVAARHSTWPPEQTGWGAPGHCHTCPRPRRPSPFPFAYWRRRQTPFAATFEACRRTNGVAVATVAAAEAAVWRWRR